VYFIPSNIEPFFWLAIFIVCAFIIAKRAPGRHFLHGLALGLVNCVWVTAAHVGLFATYIANHPREANMMMNMPLPTHPRLMMLIIGPVVGVISGVVIGVFAWIASKLVKPA
jgi:hypothetical protein